MTVHHVVHAYYFNRPNGHERSWLALCFSQRSFEEAPLIGASAKKWGIRPSAGRTWAQQSGRQASSTIFLVIWYRCYPWTFAGTGGGRREGNEGRDGGIDVGWRLGWNGMIWE